MIEDDSCSDSKTTHADDSNWHPISSTNMQSWGDMFVGLFTDANPALLVRDVADGSGPAEKICLVHKWVMDGDFVKRNIIEIEFGDPCADCMQFHWNSVSQLTNPVDISGKSLGDAAEIFLFEETGETLPACDGSSYYYVYYKLECTDGYSPSIKFADVYTYG